MPRREPTRGARRVSVVDQNTTTAERPVVTQPAPREARPDFSAFYRDAYPSVARALGATLGNYELGAEATDEAMARAYARWQTVRDYDNPPGWVYRVGLNWARSLHRKLRPRHGWHQVSVVDPPTITDPAVDEALRELDLPLRSVVVCRFLLDWSTDTTADALNIRPGTVKSRLHRAMRLLEGKLAHMNHGA